MLLEAQQISVSSIGRKSSERLKHCNYDSRALSSLLSTPSRPR